MKKTIGIFVMTLLIITAILPLVSSNNNFNNYETINETTIFEKSKYQYNMPNIIPAKGYLYTCPVTCEITEPIISGDFSPKIKIMNTPDYFNWKDHEGQDWTTPAKEQGSCGSCWDFAAIGVIESSINIQEELADLDPDLSEQYVLSCLYGGSCSGGSDTTAFKAIIDNSSRGNDCNGIIPEYCFPYQADDSIPCDEKTEDWEDYLVPLVDWGVFNPSQNNTEDRNTIKSLIMQYGPITTSMLASENFSNWGYTNHNSDDYFSYEYSNTLNHCVMLVGWKDDDSIGNGGYWICKNSYGNSFGYDGFFNIEYGSLYIDGAVVAWIEYDPDDYDWHPVPKTNGPYYGLIDDSLQLFGDAVGEHPPFTWYWDLGDESSSTMQNPPHTYSSPGDYPVVLKVTDDNGDSFFDETFAWIQETNQPPLPPTIEGPSEIQKGEYCWYNFSFSDPDGTPVYLYVHAFGIESGIWWGPYPSGYGMQHINYYWEEEGDFVVKAKTKDPYGVESDWVTLEVIVSKTKQKSDTLFMQLLDNYPNIFILLRQLLELK